MIGHVIFAKDDNDLTAQKIASFPLLVGAMQGFRAYEANHMELFHVYSASRWRIFRSLILPSSLPYLFAGLKLAAPLAVLGSLTAELTGFAALRREDVLLRAGANFQVRR